MGLKIFGTRISNAGAWRSGTESLKWGYFSKPSLGKVSDESVRLYFASFGFAWGSGGLQRELEGGSSGCIRSWGGLGFRVPGLRFRV